MRLRVMVLLLITLIGAAGCQRSFLAAVNVGGGVKVAPYDVVYDPAHGTGLTVYPATATRGVAPVAMFLYGGSWQGGRRQDYAFVGQALARCGVTTAIADYRKSPEVVFPVFVEDAARALTWTRDTLAPAAADGTRAPLFLIGTNWVYGLRRWTTLLLFPGVITLLIFLIFRLMLKVAL